MKRTLLLIVFLATFGTAAPDGSVTVPTIVASCANAHIEKAKISMLKTAKRCKRWSLQACRILLAHFETKFIASLRNEFFNGEYSLIST